MITDNLHTVKPFHSLMLETAFIHSMSDLLSSDDAYGYKDHSSSNDSLLVTVSKSVK